MAVVDADRAPALLQPGCRARRTRRKLDELELPQGAQNTRTERSTDHCHWERRTALRFARPDRRFCARRCACASLVLCAPRLAGDGGPVCLVYLAGAGRTGKGVRVAELPSGTVTFLFTDVEGSTRLWEEHPEAMKVALARHDAILRDAVAEHDGHVVKTTGDGIHAVFATAHDALDAAVAMQLGLARSRSGRRVLCGCGWGCTPARRSTGKGTISVVR